jgi:CheY-like chemotaxis protein
VAVQRPVIYIEDEPNDALLMQIAFQRAGIENPLIVLTDGQEAIEYLARVKEAADKPCLLLVDLNLTRKSGFEVVEWVRAQPAYQNLPVVILTSSEHDTDREQAHKLGVDEFLVKSPRLDQLGAMMQMFYDRWLRHCAMQSAA